ncbi:MAG: glutathione S-transferase family protein [Hyphomicrobiales bacterium]
MKQPLVFFTNPMSRGRTVRWMLEEIGQPYETRVIAFGPEMKAASYRAINPMGKVPALQHGSTTITEVGAILAYLADAFPDAGLAPAVGDAARGDYYRWMFFAAGALEYAVTNQSFGFTLGNPKDRGRMGYGSYEDAIAALEQGVAGKTYLAGASFTAADLYVTAFLAYAMMVGGIEKKPAFEAYVSHHVNRPAALRARSIDDALIPKPA